MKKHRSGLIAISGHHDCAGNPGDEKMQKYHIAKAVEFLKEKYPKIDVVGLWIDYKWKVRAI